MKLRIKVKNVHHPHSLGFPIFEWQKQKNLLSKIFIAINKKDMQSHPVFVTVRTHSNENESVEGLELTEVFHMRRYKGYVICNIDIECITMREYEKNFKKYCEDSEPFEPGRWEYHQGDGRKNLLNHATEYYNDGKLMIVREEGSDNILAIRGKI